MEDTCKQLHEIVAKHEEMIKELTLEISYFKEELLYMNELIDSVSESIENNYFN